MGAHARAARRAPVVLSARVGALVLLLVAAACSRDRGPLAHAVIQEAPEPYALVRAPATGPLDARSASVATIADPAALLQHLRSAGFRRGHARVWQSDDGFITALVLEFGDRSGALGLVGFEVEALAARAGFFAVDDVPGAVGYTVDGVTRRGLRKASCRGAWFARDIRAYGVTACGAKTPPEALVAALTRRQEELARDG